MNELDIKYKIYSKLKVKYPEATESDLWSSVESYYSLLTVIALGE